VRFKDTINPDRAICRLIFSATFGVALLVGLANSPSSLAQDASVYGMNSYPPGYAPTGTSGYSAAPGFSPPVSPGIQPTVSQFRPDFVQSFTPDFWKGKSLVTGLQAGTVLTGVLQDKLSSKSSKVGDVFVIGLPDGYVENGNELLPKGTKILGAVTQVMSGQQSRNGQPGRVDIALQTLVLPDGRSTPVYALIERNPNLEFQEDPRTPKKGLPLGEYGQSLKSSAAGIVNSITRRATGLALYYPGRTGAELSMEPGQMLPLRLNRPLDLAALLRQPIPSEAAATVPGTASVSGLVDTQPPKAPPFRPATVPNEDTEDGQGSQPQSNIPDPF